MTKFWFLDPTGDLPGPVFSRESRRARREALQTLSNDDEQLWRKLADRFGDPAAARPQSLPDLQDSPESLINLNWGRRGMADRRDGLSTQACEYVRHA